MNNRNTGDFNTGDFNTGNRNTGNRNTGDFNTGYFNTGDRNTGDFNTGDRNTGDFNTGNRNTGDFNTGNRNTGDFNTGDRNTGDFNTGDFNTGSRNTGSRNTGDFNTGDFNTGNRNTGCFMTRTQNKIWFFNKPSEWTYEDWHTSGAYELLEEMPKSDIIEWVDMSEMTEDEKKKNPHCTTTGGYLKISNYYEHRQIWWGGLSIEDKNIIKSLPNFDASIFEECTGIKVD